MRPFDFIAGVFAAVACVAVVVVAARLDPDPRGLGTHEQLGLPPCAFYLEHGLPCLSCGMTTAFAAMAHARIGAAVDANPFGAALFVVTLLFPLYVAASLRRGRSPLRFLWEPRTRRILPTAGLLLLINWGWMLLRAKRGGS